MKYINKDIYIYVCFTPISIWVSYLGTLYVSYLSYKIFELLDNHDHDAFWVKMQKKKGKPP